MLELPGPGSERDASETACGRSAEKAVWVRRAYRAAPVTRLWVVTTPRRGLGAKEQRKLESRRQVRILHCCGVCVLCVRFALRKDTPSSGGSQI